MTAPVEPISDAELKVVGFLDHVATEALVKGGDPPEEKPILAMMVARIEADAAALADRDARIAALTAGLAEAEARAMPEARRYETVEEIEALPAGNYLVGSPLFGWTVAERGVRTGWRSDGAGCFPARYLRGRALIGPLSLPSLSTEGR